MRKHPFIFCALAWLLTVGCQSVKADDGVGESSPVDVLVDVAHSFVGTPYVGGTLEVNAPDERLVVNLQEVDCTTFVDQVLALTWAMTDKEATTLTPLLIGSDTLAVDTALFHRYLTSLRYREGVVDGYVSRLHYFTDMMAQAERDNRLVDVTPTLPGAVASSVTLGFMSSHPGSYPVLAASAEAVEQIRAVEQRYQQYPVSVLPKENIEAASDAIHDGDVIALVTTIDGLDVSHLGFAMHVDGRLHLLNASSQRMRVVEDERTLTTYLAGRKSCPAIRVYRLK